MAIITNSAFNKLINSFSKVITDEELVSYDNFLKNVFNNKMIYFTFNKLERQKLFAAKSLLEDEKGFINKYFREVGIREDDMKFVYQTGGKYKYHLYADCIAVTKRFVDFIIPEEIRNLGPAGVQEFRKWFSKGAYKQKYEDLIHIEEDQNTENLDARQILVKKNNLNREIIREYNSIFPAKYQLPLIPENYYLIREIENSGITEIEDGFSQNEFNKLLGILITKRSNLFSKNKEFRQKLAKLDFLLKKEDDDIRKVMQTTFSEDILAKYLIEDFKKFWQMHVDIKHEIYNLLIKYFQWTNSYSEKEYNVIDLHTFGFICCGVCETRKATEIQEAQKP